MQHLFQRPHRQVVVGRPNLGVRFEVDEGVAIAVQRILDAGFRTLHSCQWDGPIGKKFPAYINPGATDGEWRAVLRSKEAQLDAIGSDGTRDERADITALTEAIAQTRAMIAGLSAIGDARDLAAIIGLSAGEYRLYNQVIWFRPWL